MKVLNNYQLIITAINIVIMVAVLLALAVLDTFLKEMRELFYGHENEKILKEIASEAKEMEGCAHLSGTYTELDHERNTQERCNNCRKIINKENNQKPILKWD